MAKKPIEVEALKHDAATRKNIPTAEFESVMREADKTPIQLAYERRNRDLDPQLVWRGKDEQDWSDLIVSAPPLYIQEKVHPKVIIDDLQRFRPSSLRGGKADEAIQSGSLRSARDDEQPDLFADFNGLQGSAAATEFYQHDQHWSNRMISGDSLSVMASLAEREGLRGQVQCIYVDPPYGIKFNSNFQWSTTSRDVKDGAKDHITREPEQVRAFRDTWRDGIHSYLTYLRDRLTVARDLLHESGSIFVQIGDENVHRVRALMDEVFGDENFISQIAFRKTTGSTSVEISNTHDYMIWYSRSQKIMKYRPLFWEQIPGEEGAKEYKRVELASGDLIPASKFREHGELKLPDGARLLTTGDISSKGGDDPDVEVEHEGRKITLSCKPNRHWKSGGVEGVKRLWTSGRLLRQKGLRIYKRYFNDFPYTGIVNVWNDTRGEPDPDYVVQTSELPVQRCILMTTDPGDLVLDPTCGSGTTAYVAEQWGRRWITIDTSRVAIALARSRLMGARYPYYLLADSPEGQRKIWELSGKPPPSLRATEGSAAIQAGSPRGSAPRDDKDWVPSRTTRGDLRHGFVYERVPHITLKSIANNAEIDVIWERMQPAVEEARAALNVALKGHAEPFKVDTGGRAGKTIDFRKEGDVTLPSGEPAPAGGFMEWEIPREPGTPWPEAQAKLLQKARTIATTRRAEAERVLAELNRLRRSTYSLDTLPERAVTPWPPLAVEAVARFWEARIARQKEIDASIAAKAEFEYLFDKPYVDNAKVRVAGPFTVESLSPHRTLAVDWDDSLIDDLAETGLGYRHDGPAPDRDFAGMILENLKTAGVQQAHKEDRITFTSLTGWPGHHICAEGMFMEGEAQRRAGIFIGPEFGTVSRPDLVAAAREAGDAGFDVLIACAFSYDAHSAEFDKLGRVPVLKARMNPDLHMGGDLKSTATANLFVIFGEPDIKIEAAGDDLIRVKVFGVDVFKPQTGEIVSEGTDGIALWMLDTDYNEESFFVRHAYFLGANDPYKALKTTLKAEIDEEAWESLHSDTSRPFPKPPSGRIAVKVINHLGDEVMKVFGVA